MSWRCLFMVHLWGEEKRLDSLFLLYRQCERCGKMKRTGVLPRPA